jgi:predicted deacetylase
MSVTAIAKGACESLERQNLSIRSFADPLWQLSQTKCPFSHAALEITADLQ